MTSLLKTPLLTLSCRLRSRRRRQLLFGLDDFPSAISYERRSSNPKYHQRHSSSRPGAVPEQQVLIIDAGPGGHSRNPTMASELVAEIPAHQAGGDGSTVPNLEGASEKGNGEPIEGVAEVWYERYHGR